MSVFASSNRWALDALTVLRPAGESASTATAHSDNSYSLEILQSYWAAGDEADHLNMAAVFTVEAAFGGTSPTCTFIVEVSTASNFSGAVTIGSVAATGVGVYILPILREQLVAALGGPDASLTGFLRGTATIGGTSPTVAWNVYLAPQAGV